MATITSASRDRWVVLHERERRAICELVELKVREGVEDRNLARTVIAAGRLFEHLDWQNGPGDKDAHWTVDVDDDIEWLADTMQQDFNKLHGDRRAHLRALVRAVEKIAAAEPGAVVA